MRHHRPAIVRLVLLFLTLVPAALAAAQAPASDSDLAPETVQQLEELAGAEVDELRIRLTPLTLEQLEIVQTTALASLEELSETLASALVERLRLQASPELDTQTLEASDRRILSLMERKADLVSRANVVVAAIERKGGDAAAARAYVSAIETLVPEDVDSSSIGSGDPQPPEADEAVRQRVAELVAMIRAEPPAHERPVPWEVPLSELELELQPLPVDLILERLGKWREILQREVRKRVRIDILLNDSVKLEQTTARRAEEGRWGGAPVAEVDAVAIKSRLAERSQEQQQIISDIVRRMEVAIRLVERRGGDTDEYTKYIAAATGQKLNLTDPAVLRAQLFAWLRSPDGGLKIGLNLLKFIGIVIVFWLVSRVLGSLTGAAVRRVPKASSLLAPVLVATVRRVTMFIGLVIGISMLGVNIGPLLAMIGAAGLVIGLALQGTLSNFASGILILLNRPYEVGNVINAGGVLGKVEAMNLVSTTILTFDNQLMLVPNNQIWNGVITNITGKPTRRVDLVFGIGYADDMDKAIGIIQEVITAHPKVHAEPAPTIRVNELGDNSVNVIARPWSNTADYWDVYWDVMHAVKKRFDEEGINIPFPQRDVHLPGPIEVKLSRDSIDPRGADDDGARKLEGVSARSG